MENLLFLGVPILKHIRVYQCYSNNLFEVVSIAQLVEVTDSAVLGSVVKVIIHELESRHGSYFSAFTGIVDLLYLIFSIFFQSVSVSDPL